LGSRIHQVPWPAAGTTEGTGNINHTKCSHLRTTRKSISHSSWRDEPSSHQLRLTSGLIRLRAYTHYSLFSVFPQWFIDQLTCNKLMQCMLVSCNPKPLLLYWIISQLLNILYQNTLYVLHIGRMNVHMQYLYEKWLCEKITLQISGCFISKLENSSYSHK
jgi:hypothetical protein